MKRHGIAKAEVPGDVDDAQLSRGVLFDERERTVDLVAGGLDLTGKTLIATSDGNGPFMGTGITSARGVGALPSRIFYQCTSLTNVSCVAGIVDIPNRTFAGCSALAEVSAADDFAAVTNVGQAVFYACPNNLVIPQNWPSLLKVGPSAFRGVILKPGRTLSFPVLAETPGMWSFESATADSLDFRGSTFEVVSDGMFSFASKIIGYRGNIVNLILPETVTTLKTESFLSWTGRHDLRFCGFPPMTIEDGTFRGDDEYKELYIHVPREPEKLAAWKQDANFVALTDIPDVETKPGWDAIKDSKRLIGAWRNKWCFTWNASPKKGLILLFQ